MRVYKKDVYLGTKFEYCLSNEKNFQTIVLKKNYTSVKVDSNCILIKIDENTFIDYNELIESPLPQSLAKKHIQKYKTIPQTDGEIYVGNLTRYFNIKRKNTEDKIEIDMIQYSQKPKSL